MLFLPYLSRLLISLLLYIAKSYQLFSLLYFKMIKKFQLLIPERSCPIGNRWNLVRRFHATTRAQEATRVEKSRELCVAFYFFLISCRMQYDVVIFHFHGEHKKFFASIFRASSRSSLALVSIEWKWSENISARIDMIWNIKKFLLDTQSDIAWDLDWHVSPQFGRAAGDSSNCRGRATAQNMDEIAARLMKKLLEFFLHRKANQNFPFCNTFN